MVAVHSARSGTVVRSWADGDTVEGGSSHILAQYWAAVIDTHSEELVCHDMQQGKLLHVLGLVVVVDF